MARKIIQISSCGVENSVITQCNAFLFALCDDGTLWEQRNTFSTWQQVSPVPSEPCTIEAAATSHNKRVIPCRKKKKRVTA